MQSSRLICSCARSAHAAARTPTSFAVRFIHAPAATDSTKRVPKPRGEYLALSSMLAIGISSSMQPLRSAWRPADIVFFLRPVLGSGVAPLRVQARARVVRRETRKLERTLHQDERRLARCGHGRQADAVHPLAPRKVPVRAAGWLQGRAATAKTNMGEVYRQGHDPATVAVAPTPKKTVRTQFRRSRPGLDCEN